MYEDEFILNAARLNLSEENISILRDISKKDINWEYFSKKAINHGVSSFIYCSLKKYDLSLILPKNIYCKFESNFYQTAYQNSFFLDEIDRISSLIDQKIILLKGADIIQTLYPNIAIRNMCDIDMLVKKEDAQKIWNNLQDIGYRIIAKEVYKSTIHYRLNELSKICYIRHLPSLYNKNIMVEIHWDLLRGTDNYDITEMAWKTAVPFNLNNNFYRLSNEFMLVHLCSHFYYHLTYGGIPLRFLCDINELVLKYKEKINWNEIDYLCKYSQIKNKIETALTYTYILLKTPVRRNYINEDLLNIKFSSLDSLLEGRKDLFDEVLRTINLKAHEAQQKKIIKKFFPNLIVFQKPSDIIIFIFRTIIPVKKWIINTYKVTDKDKIWKAYLHYWKYLFQKHLLTKQVTPGKLRDKY